MNDQTIWALIILFILVILISQRERTRHIPTKSKRLAWAKFHQEFYRNPANNNKKLRMRDYEFDHIVPFSKGGTHDPDNIQILPKKDNRRKGAKRSYT